MKEKIAIRFDGVSKKYHLKELVFSSSDYFWALRNLSFDVRKGESLGLVGPNGAGKTTVMKLISAITVPTEGAVRISGKVVPLISIEGAINFALTCEENIYLLCAVLGLKLRDIKKRVGSILDFSNLNDFRDMQVKHFSSGMVARLSFSIAAFVTGDIIVIDEILATGDREFQEKCFAKIDEYKKSGKTIVFASHDAEELKKVCTRAIWIDKGKMVMSGDAKKVVGAYSGNEKYSTG